MFDTLDSKLSLGQSLDLVKVEVAYVLLFDVLDQQQMVHHTIFIPKMMQRIIILSCIIRIARHYCKQLIIKLGRDEASHS